MRAPSRTVTRRIVGRLGLLLALVPVLALPLQALAGAEVPYKGSDSGGYTIPGTCAPGIFRIDISGSGHGTQVGRYSYSASECFDPVASAVTGSFTLTAANGDTLSGTYSGPCVGATCTETALIEGGTGRFAGAEGELNVTVLVTGPDTYSETASGTISTPGSMS